MFLIVFVLFYNLCVEENTFTEWYLLYINNIVRQWLRKSVLNQIDLGSNSHPAS